MERSQGEERIDAPESFAARLRRRYGEGIDPAVSLEEETAASEESSAGRTGELLQRLAAHALSWPRYKLEGEVARGGMGAILRVWDADLRRHLAMKVVAASSEGRTDAVDPLILARFLEEAQVTGQLDHPGIVPVHELGLDADGRVFFTMKLVKGRDLKHIFDLVFAGEEGWNETRALGVLLKVCEAMGYAHRKNVIHRDLKPANVMVGSFGEVYVMDWGLARILGRRDAHDIRLRSEMGTSISVRTERRDVREESPDSPLITMDGDVVGTPAYMPPEQARGEVEHLSPRSDVYAIGAMLYHLLARQMPYLPPGVRVSNRVVLARVIDGPPSPLHALRSDVPAELAAICEKAMAYDPKDRYSDTLALAEDLQAYLENRVVKAYRTGAVVELKKWVVRNRGLAGATAASLAIALSGLLGISIVQARSARAIGLSNDSLRIANGALQQAREKADESARRASDEALLAQAESQKALAVQTFLMDSLRAAAPEHGRPADYKLRDWLDAVAGRMKGGSLADQPRVRASLEALLSTCYHSLADDWASYLHAKSALGILDKEGIEDPDTKTHAFVSVGESVIGFRDSGQTSEELEKEGLAALQAAVALLKRDEAKWAVEIRAIEGSVAYLEKHEETHLWPDPVVAYIAALWGRKDLDGVRRELDDRFWRITHAWEAGDHSTATKIIRDGCLNLGSETGRSIAATFVERMGIEAQRRKIYPFAEASYAAGAELIAEDKNLARGRLGILLHRASLQCEMGRWEEAQVLLEEILPELRRVLGPVHEETATAERLLAETLERRGMAQEALARIESLRAATVEKFGPGSPELVPTLRARAAILDRSGRSEEALGVLREAVDLPAGSNYAGTVERLRLLVDLGRCLTRTRQFESAEARLQEAWTGLRDLVPPPGGLAGECKRAFVELYDGWGRPEQAGPYR